MGFTVLDTEGGSYDLDMGVREVATSLHGQVVSARPTDIDGHAALDVEVSTAPATSSSSSSSMPTTTCCSHWSPVRRRDAT